MGVCGGFVAVTLCSPRPPPTCCRQFCLVLVPGSLGGGAGREQRTGWSLYCFGRARQLLTHGRNICFKRHILPRSGRGEVSPAAPEPCDMSLPPMGAASHPWVSSFTSMDSQLYIHGYPVLNLRICSFKSLHMQFCIHGAALYWLRGQCHCPRWGHCEVPKPSPNPKGTNVPSC